MTKTWNFLTGTLRCAKTSANRSIPRPLLVVHSGKTTSGLSAFIRMSSRLLQPDSWSELGGTLPVKRNIERRVT